MFLSRTGAFSFDSDGVSRVFRRDGKAQMLLPGLAALLWLILAAVVSGAATFLAQGAPFLSVWIVFFSFFPIVGAIFWLLPPPAERFVAVFFAIFFLFVFSMVVWPRYALLRAPGLPGISLSRAIQLLLLFGWFYIFLRSETIRDRLMRRVREFWYVFLAIAILLFFKSASVFVSDYPFLSAKGVANEVVSVYLPLLMTLSFVRHEGDLKRLCLVLLFAGVVVAALGLYESRVGHNLFFGILDVDSDYLQQVLRDKIRAGAYRIQSTFSHPLTFSEFLSFSIPVIFFAVFSRRVGWVGISFYVGYSALVAYVILKSGSRSGLGGFLVAQASVFGTLFLRGVFQRRSAFLAGFSMIGIIFSCSLAAVALYFISDILIGRTSSEFNSGMVRLAMWSHGLSLAATSPFFGFGQDTAAEVLGFVGHGGVLTIDSYFLSVLLESGFVSLVCFATILVIAFVLAMKALRYEGKAALLCSLLGGSVLVFSLVKAVLSLPHNHGVFMVLYGCLLISYELASKESMRRDEGATPGGGR